MSMNAETIYSCACDILYAQLKDLCGTDPNSNADKFFRKAMNDPFNCGLDGFAHLAPTLRILQAAKEEMGKTSMGSAYAGFKSIFKSINPGSRRQYSGVFRDPEGRYCLSDGYRVVRQAAEIKGIPEASEPGGDLSGAFPTASIPLEPVSLPSPGELKALMAEQKGRKHKLYDFGPGKPLVDAEFLRDMMRILPDAEAFVPAGKGETAPIYMKTDKADGLLLPVRKIPTTPGRTAYRKRSACQYEDRRV